ncbi:MAG: pyrimidine reductase family protein [Frankiales bacterium]|nr:pyrimidine reductase family protein [Frankiales bacterium]
MVAVRTLLPDPSTARPDPATPAEGGPQLQSPETDLYAHYGANWLDEGGVRANFIASVDGAASAAGVSAGLQTPGDNRVFAALRDLADVILVGASTASVEGYAPAAPGSQRRARRLELGLAEAPAIAVLSGSLGLDLSRPLFNAVERLAPTIIVTSSAAPMSRRNDIIDLAASVSELQLIEVPADAGGNVDFVAAVAQLRELGYRRILCEGGPRVLASGITAGQIDELCLTISPMLGGTDTPRILNGPAWPADFLPQLSLTGLLIEDDALFCRYLVRH